MIKKYNITKAKTYVKDGQEKTLWQNVGTLTEFWKEDGSVSRKIEIPAIGLDCQVFPFDDKGASSERVARPQPQKSLTPEEEYNKYGSKTEMVDEVIDSSEIPY